MKCDSSAVEITAVPRINPTIFVNIPNGSHTDSYVQQSRPQIGFSFASGLGLLLCFMFHEFNPTMSLGHCRIKFAAARAFAFVCWLPAEVVPVVCHSRIAWTFDFTLVGRPELPRSTLRWVSLPSHGCEGTLQPFVLSFPGRRRWDHWVDLLFLFHRNILRCVCIVVASL